MKCDFCGNEFSNKQNLNAHQTKTKYCLKIQNKSPCNEYTCDSCGKIFLSNTTLRRHKTNCSSLNLVTNLNKKINELTERNILLEERCKILSEQLSKSEHRYDTLSLSAIKRPNTSTKNVQINNYIKNMNPLLSSDITSNIQNLTLEHHVKGVEGYAEYALEFPFKNKIVCVDVQRNKIKYKNEEGDIIEDIGFRKMMIKLCDSLKDRSFNLSQEHYQKLSETFSEKEMDDFNFMETAIAIGRENDFCNKIIKMISKEVSIKE